MRTALKLSIFLSAILFLSGCDSNQYQVVNAPDGTLYRFNKKTGELSVIMDNSKVSRIAAPGKKLTAKDKDDASLEKPEDWKELRYPGKNLKIRLQTVWREGRLCYRCSLYPYKSLERIFAKKKQDYVYSLMKPGFTIELVDKNGFIVKDIKVMLWHMIRTQGENGAPEELVINSQVDCSRESYKSIGAFTVKWFLEDNLIDDEEEQYLKSSSL